MDLLSSALAPSPALLQQPGSPSAVELAKRGKIQETARAFETSFLSTMIQQMFVGLKTDGPFGGGPGEEMFRSFLTDAMARKITQSGGIGVADSVAREMLKLQGLN